MTGDGAVAKPARGYTWPQFEPSHGAHAPARIAPLAGGYESTLLRLANTTPAFSYLLEPMYRPAIRAWAWAEARVLLLEAWLDEHDGPIADDGKVRGAAELLERVSRRAIRERSRLGLDPLSRARLQVDVGMAGSLAANLDRLRESGAAYWPATTPQDGEDAAGADE